MDFTGTAKLLVTSFPLSSRERAVNRTTSPVRTRVSSASSSIVRTGFSSTGISSRSITPSAVASIVQTPLPRAMSCPSSSMDATASSRLAIRGTRSSRSKPTSSMIRTWSGVETPT